MSPPPSSGCTWCRPALALLCCRRRSPMGAGLSQTQDGAILASQHAAQPATMAEVVRERKKKMNGGLATLRRRLLAGRRGGRGSRLQGAGDRAAPLRDLLKEWSPLEVSALLEEYEALAALRDLCVQAELARPPAPALRGDLATLYHQRICPDTELIFKGTSFPVHRAILSARCPYFRELLANYPGVGARVCLEGPMPPQVDAIILDGLLWLLYTGEPAPPPCPNCAIEGENSQTWRRQQNSVPDCCPAQNNSGRLSLDVVGGNSGGCTGASPCPRRAEPVILRRLASDLGAAPAALHRDMRHLLDTAEFADASLVFTSEPSASSASSTSDGCTPRNGNGGQNVQRQGSPPSSDYGFRPRLELPCHRAVLSARSPFFRSVISRRCRQQGTEVTGCVKIVLDEKVIPHKYARVLLHAVYTDQVDLNLIMRGGNSIFGCSILGNHNASIGETLNNGQQGSSLSSSGKGTPNGTTNHIPSPLEEAMELYEIGRFLELDILSQGCEDIIAERLSANSLAAVLRWSAQPHGSKWVHRQALRFLREEFQSVASGPALQQLEAQHLSHALRCPFLQASELDALRAALRWGEYTLIKRMEDREPNLLSHTAHSVTRKGVKKRDLSDTELRELLADLLPLVRIDHILPPNNELLNQAIRRGLVSSPPSCMLGDDGATASRADAWIRGKGHGGLYVRPRLFMPYYEEVKALLEDQMVQETELVRLRRARYIPDIPDTLYMVSRPCTSGSSGAPVESPRGEISMAGSSNHGAGIQGEDEEGIGNTAEEGDGINGSNGTAAVPPPPAQMNSMINRERELKRAQTYIRAVQLPLSNTAEIDRQIRLRVVREFNLPDSVADLLEGASLEAGTRASAADSDDIQMEAGVQVHNPADPQRHCMDDEESDHDGENSNGRFQNSRDNLDSWSAGSPGTSRKPLPALLTEGDNRTHTLDSSLPRQRRRRQQARGLSEAMPDVAMATSSLRRMRIVSGGEQQPVATHQHQNAPVEKFTDSCENLQSRDAHVGSSYSLESGCEDSGTGRHRSKCQDSNRVSSSHMLFMNPNQHLLQEGIGVYGSRSNNREPQPMRGQNTWNGQDQQAYNQRMSGEIQPGLQLDLGDGTQHASPGRQLSGAQSPWMPPRSHQVEPVHRTSATLPSDLSLSQYSRGGGASYSRYLSNASPSQQIQQLTTFQPLPQHEKQKQPELDHGTPLYTFTPAPAQFANQGFSTLQHHSRSRSPRVPPAMHTVTLQRPRPICPLPSGHNTPPQCSQSSSRNSLLGDKETVMVPRSQSAGSVTSLGIDPDRRDTAKGVQNVSGYNPPTGYAPQEGQPQKEYSPRHFRSISALPDTYDPSRVTAYQLGANLIENSVGRQQYEWIQQQQQQQHYDVDRSAFLNRYNLRTVNTSPFQTENINYSRGESPYASQRPGSCGLADIMQVGYSGTNSRGDSPLYSLNPSRGSSPFRTLETNTAQFSRGNSPYSSTHRNMDYQARNQENYCQMPRSSSPGCRVYSSQQQRTLSNSPSNLKITSSARNISNSPSDNFKMQNTRTLSNSPSASSFNNSLKLQSGRNMSSSPSSTFVNPKSMRTTSNSPSTLQYPTQGLKMMPPQPQQQQSVRQQPSYNPQKSSSGNVYAKQTSRASPSAATSSSNFLGPPAKEPQPNVRVHQSHSRKTEDGYEGDKQQNWKPGCQQQQYQSRPPARY